MGQIIRFIFDAVKTAEIKREVDGGRNVLHLRGVVSEDAGIYSGLLQFSSGGADGVRDEVETFCLPACIDKCHEIGACAAADVERASRRMRSDEIIKFGR